MKPRIGAEGDEAVQEGRGMLFCIPIYIKINKDSMDFLMKNSISCGLDTVC